MKQRTKSPRADRIRVGLAAVCTVAALSALTPAAAAAKPTAEVEADAWVPDGYRIPGPEMEVKRGEPVEHISPVVGEGSDLISPQGPYTRAHNKKYEGQRCGLDIIRQTSGNGPQTLTLSISDSVSTEWNASVSIAAKWVSAGVGFSVTKTYTVTQGTSYSVPKGKYGHIAAYPLYDMYSFDTMLPTGTGYAMKPVGVCFSKWTS